MRECAVLKKISYTLDVQNLCENDIWTLHICQTYTRFLLFILMESPTTLSFLSAIGHICLFDFILKLAKEGPKGSLAK